MLNNVQEVTRQIISEYFRSEINHLNKSIPCASEKEARNCGVVSINEIWGELQPFISLVVQLLIRLWTRIGTIFGFSPESHLSEAERKNLITFLEDDDPSHTRMRIVVSGLQELIRKDGINDLQPIQRNTMDIFIQHVWRDNEMSEENMSNLSELNSS